MKGKPRTLADILNRSGKAAALVARVRAQSALLLRVREELDPALNEHVLAALMRRGELILYVDSSAWASRLRFGSRMLLGRLTGGGLKVERIRVRIAIRPGEGRRIQGLERKLSRENGTLIEHTADTIDDPGLRQALRRLSRHRR